MTEMASASARVVVMSHCLDLLSMYSYANVADLYLLPLSTSLHVLSRSKVNDF